jgi:4-diphosphocytidyl-2-C-methyl-D-erythritol kinase
MSSPVLFKAFAKLNFYLDVIRKRPDGYHDIETIFQSVSLYDTLKFTPNPSEIEVITAHPDLPPQEHNLVYRAATLLKQETETRDGVTIALEKNIPIGAGLGGGSSDAAATLAALNLIWSTDCAEDTLLKVAARIGSDVPFCFVGGTAAGTGRGEKLLKLPPVGRRWLVIITPPFSVSTADVYSRVTVAVAEPDRAHEVTDRFRAVIEHVRSGNVEDVLYNVMERIVTKRYPQLNELKRALERAGCPSALMSGSGPTMFGLVASRDDGIAVVGELKRAYPDCFVTLASTQEAGWERISS